MLGVWFGLPSTRTVTHRSKSSKATEAVGAGARTRLFSEVHWDRRRDNRHKLKPEKFWPDIRGKNCHKCGQTLEADPGEGVTSLLLMFRTCWTEP